VSRAGVLGLGLWVPDEVRRNGAWPRSFIEAFAQTASARSARDFTTVEARGDESAHASLMAKHAGTYEHDPFRGAVERRVSSEDVPTAECDARAARLALEDAGVDARDVDHVLSAALVPDRIVPSNGPAVQHLAGCRSAVGLGVDSVCSSALSQLEIAAALVESGRARLVLCVQSHHVARANDLTVPFSPMFGDASSAFVVGSVAPDRGLTFLQRDGDGALASAITFVYSRTPGARWYRDARGPVHPGTDDVVAARHLNRHLLRLAVEAIRLVSENARVPLDEIAAIAMIQPTAWYQAAVADALDIASERVPSTFPRYAHIGAAGVVANLIEARARGLLRDGSPVVLYAHGAGITRYAALVRWRARCRSPQ